MLLLCLPWPQDSRLLSMPLRRLLSRPAQQALLTPQRSSNLSLGMLLHIYTAGDHGDHRKRLP